MPYFSEREEGPRPRKEEKIQKTPWGGIDSLIRRYLANGCFGTMPDQNVFWRALRAEVPALPELIEYQDSSEPPPTLVILDVIEFCWHAIEKPIPKEEPFSIKPYPVAEGRKEFRATINLIFRRNALAYELSPDGRVNRLLEPVLQEQLVGAQFSSGDRHLDQLLETARRKFLDPNEDIRREALKDLWDAFERLKTLGCGTNKKEQVRILLDKIAGSDSSKFREELEREFQTLTRIGNQLHIRHSEAEQEHLASGAHVDYLFHRLFALIQLILRRRS